MPAGARSTPLQWSPSAVPVSECLRVCRACCANADAEGNDAFNVVGSAPYLYDVTDPDAPKASLAR